MTAPNPLAGHAAIATAYQARIDELQELLDRSCAAAADADERRRYAEEDTARERKARSDLADVAEDRRKEIAQLNAEVAHWKGNVAQTIDNLQKALRTQPDRRGAIRTIATTINDLKEIDHHDAD